jgi:hypothetical protein
MRLHVLEHGHTRTQKAMFWLARRYLDPLPGPILAMSYRPRLFGRFMARALQEAMRKATRWSASEAELMCAFVSKQNRCKY